MIPTTGELDARRMQVTAAAGLFDRLPAFPDASIDEILDLRARVERPVEQFRSAMAELTQSFSVGPLEDGFDDEVQEAWVRTVRPSVLDIEEAFEEAGFRRQKRLS